MPKTLKQNVHVDGKWYGPSYGNADLPSKIADLIDNPAAFESPDAGIDQTPASSLDAIARSVAGGSGSSLEPSALDSMTRDQLLALADERGVEVGSKDNKDVLVAKLSGE